jgi:hypothetical protein
MYPYLIRIIFVFIFMLVSTNTIWVRAGECNTDMNMIWKICIHIGRIVLSAPLSARSCQAVLTAGQNDSVPMTPPPMHAAPTSRIALVTNVTSCMRSARPGVTSRRRSTSGTRKFCGTFASSFGSTWVRVGINPCFWTPQHIVSL